MPENLLPICDTSAFDPVLLMNLLLVVSKHDDTCEGQGRVSNLHCKHGRQGLAQSCNPRGNMLGHAMHISMHGAMLQPDQHVNALLKTR